MFSQYPPLYPPFVHVAGQLVISMVTRPRVFENSFNIHSLCGRLLQMFVSLLHILFLYDYVHQSTCIENQLDYHYFTQTKRIVYRDTNPWAWILL